MHHQDDDQLPVADLGATNNEWARFTQFRPRFQQQFLFLEKLQVQHVGIRFLASGIDLQRKIFAGGKLVFFARFQGFPRLTDELKLRVTKKFSQRSLDLGYFRRCRFGRGRVACDN